MKGLLARRGLASILPQAVLVCLGVLAWRASGGCLKWLVLDVAVFLARGSVSVIDGSFFLLIMVPWLWTCRPGCFEEC